MDSMECWHNDDAPIDNKIEVKKFEYLLTQMNNLRIEIKDKEAIVDADKKVLKSMQGKLLAYLESFGKKKYITSFGTVFCKNNFSIKTPKTPEDKKAFNGWLASKGILDILTINSKTLNSLWKAEFEASGDPDFKVPGIEEPTSYQTLGVRSK